MGLANKITILRILLVPVLLISLFYYKAEYDFLRFVALGIFFICSLTDAIDGYIARKYYQKTQLGRMLDPLADKLLILTAFLALSVLHNIPAASSIPPWLTITVISRDVIILLGSLVIFMMNKEIDMVPSMLGKFTTFFQMSVVACALLQVPFIQILWYLTMIFTLSSCIGYVWRGNRILNESH